MVVVRTCARLSKLYSRVLVIRPCGSFWKCTSRVVVVWTWGRLSNSCSCVVLIRSCDRFSRWKSRVEFVRIWGRLWNCYSLVLVIRIFGRFSKCTSRFGLGSNMVPPFKLLLAHVSGSIVESPLKVLLVRGNDWNLCSLFKWHLAHRRIFNIGRLPSYSWYHVPQADKFSDRPETRVNTTRRTLESRLWVGLF